MLLRQPDGRVYLYLEFFNLAFLLSIPGREPPGVEVIYLGYLSSPQERSPSLQLTPKFVDFHFFFSCLGSGGPWGVFPLPPAGAEIMRHIDLTGERTMLMHKKIVVGLALAAALALSIPTWAQAQCGGSGGGSSHMGDMGNMGNMGPMMGSGQMGTYSPAPQGPQPPNYVAPPSNQGPAYTGPGTGGGGQMMGPGGASSGHSGHVGPTN